jgi:hypothetical protein
MKIGLLPCLCVGSCSTPLHKVRAVARPIIHRSKRDRPSPHARTVAQSAGGGITGAKNVERPEPRHDR